MRLIHSKGFTPAERNQWKVTIFQNLLQSFQTISGAMEEQEVEFEDKKNLVRGIRQENPICDNLLTMLLSVSPSSSFPIPILDLTSQCQSIA
jgi:hypothetical protein